MCCTYAEAFFFSTELGIEQLSTTLLLSPSIRAGPSGSDPIIRRRYLYSKMSSVATFAATSSDPYVEVSTVFWRLEIHFTGVLFKNRITPVTDRVHDQNPCRQ